MGAAAWWEPVVAVVLTLSAIVGLVVLGGRVYTRAILHTGATLRLADAWRGVAPSVRTLERGPGHPAPRAPTVDGPASAEPRQAGDHWVIAIVIGIAGALGAAAFALAHDFVVALAVGAGFYAVTSRLVKRHHTRAIGLGDGPEATTPGTGRRTELDRTKVPGPRDEPG
jgi:hypothetical protein